MTSQHYNITHCCICGSNGPLTFEHIPPRSALNGSKIIVSDPDKYWNQGPGIGASARGKEMQRGYGRKSLCGPCNNYTGTHYVEQFAAWCKWGSDLSSKVMGHTPVIAHYPLVFPLQIIKQILTMFIALNGEYFGGQRRFEFAKFLLNKDYRYLDPSIRFWIYLLAPGPSRNIPMSSTIDTVTGSHSSGMEFSFHPFGYMITFQQKPPDDRLADITHFLSHDYLELRTGSIRIAKLPCHGLGFGDYRKFRDMPNEPIYNVSLDFESIMNKNRH